MHIENTPELTTVEEHIAELYRRIDVLSDRITSFDLVHYPICLALRLQSPTFFDEIVSGMEAAHQQQKEAAEEQSPSDSNIAYALDRFFATAKRVQESAERIQSKAAGAGQSGD